MALQGFTVTIQPKEDSPFNVLPNAPIEIRERLANDTSGGLSLIFSDSAGLSPITQTGATANSLGQFTFYAAAAGYNAVYDNNGTPVTIPVDVGVTGTTLNEKIDGLNPATLSIAIADSSLRAGDVIRVKEDNSTRELVLASTVTISPPSVIAGTGTQSPPLAIVWQQEQAGTSIDVASFINSTADFPSAVEAAYAIAENAAGADGGATVIMPRGKFTISRPIWIYQSDGVRLKGAGRWATVLEISPTFDGDAGRPATFDAIEGNLGFSYVGHRAAFMIAARRVTGGVNNALNPAGADGNAWSLAFEGFTVIDPDEDQDVDVFYAPRIAHSEMHDIYCQGVNRFIWADDFYRGEIHHIDIFNCYRPMEILGGTTLHISNVGASRTVQGYKFHAQYSQFDNVAIDHWGQGNTGSIETYAYEFKGVGVTVNGCGCEYGIGGILRIAQRPSTTMVFNGCMFIGGATQEDGARVDWANQSSANDFGVPNGLLWINDARVTFNNTAIRMLINKNGDPLQGFEKLEMEVNGLSSVTINGLGGQEVNESLIQQKWTQVSDINSNNTSYIDAIDSRSKPIASVHTIADDTLPSNNSAYVFSGYKVDPLGLWDDIAGSYTVIISGYYKIDMTVHGEAAGLNFLSASISGRPSSDNIIAACDVTSTHPSAHMNRIVYLARGEILTFSVRTGVGTSVLLKAGAGVTVTMM